MPNSTRFEETVAVSNQTLKSDEANYRQPLVAQIAEARAGLFPTLAADRRR